MKHILSCALSALALIMTTPAASAQGTTANGCAQIHNTTDAHAQQVHRAMVTWQYGNAHAPAFSQPHAQALTQALQALRSHALSVRHLCQNTHQRTWAPSATEYWSLLSTRVQQVLAAHSSTANTVKQTDDPAVLSAAPELQSVPNPMVEQTPLLPENR